MCVCVLSGERERGAVSVLLKQLGAAAGSGIRRPRNFPLVSEPTLPASGRSPPTPETHRRPAGTRTHAARRRRVLPGPQSVCLTRSGVAHPPVRLSPVLAAQSRSSGAPQPVASRLCSPLRAGVQEPLSPSPVAWARRSEPEFRSPSARRQSPVLAAQSRSSGAPQPVASRLGSPLRAGVQEPLSLSPVAWARRSEPEFRSPSARPPVAAMGTRAVCGVSLFPLVLLTLAGSGSGSAGSVPIVFGEAGGNVTLTCQLDGVPKSVSHISWYRQDVRGSVELSAYFSSYSKKYGRYLGELPLDSNRTSLTITGLQLSDAGLYFCVMRASLQFTPGSASALAVTDPQVEPEVQLFSSPEDDQTALLCELRGAPRPDLSTPLWRVGAEGTPLTPLDPESESVGWLFDEEDVFTVSSFLSVPSSRLRGQRVVCELRYGDNSSVQAERTQQDSESEQGACPLLGFLIPLTAVLLLVAVVAVLCACRARQRRAPPAPLIPKKHRGPPEPTAPSRSRQHRSAPSRSIQHSETEYSSLNL
ncbi:uncharacterized protein [Lepisosteus oculatus]|uniref:uncharacterized protein isoform X2 n=1 Tax=Lepisosteus oculatus TaxID=7918 RepID=UPI00371DABDD